MVQWREKYQWELRIRISASALFYWSFLLWIQRKIMSFMQFIFCDMSQRVNHLRKDLAWFVWLSRKVVWKVFGISDLQLRECTLILGEFATSSLTWPTLFSSERDSTMRGGNSIYLPASPYYSLRVSCEVKWGFGVTRELDQQVDQGERTILK